MKRVDELTKINREIFLEALRSGEYQKGPFIPGESKPPKGAVGYCAVGLPCTLFGIHAQIRKGLKEKLGLNPGDLDIIQNGWNDTDLTFPQIADMIEYFIFNDNGTPPR